jgi:tetratricopeptide (TPR) repeat protein
VPNDDAPRLPAESAEAIPLATRLRARMPSKPGLSVEHLGSEPTDIERLRAQARWEELVEVLLARIEATTQGPEQAKAFVDIADAFKNGLDDGPQALDALLEAWQLDPTCEAILQPLEELARELGRWPEVFAITEKLVATERDPARAEALCERMVYWLTLEVPTPSLADHYAGRIRALDSTHAAVHLHQATVFRGHGDLRRELEELDRAALSAKRMIDQAKLHIIMATRHADGERLANPAEQKRHLVAALTKDPRSLDAILRLEAIYETHGDRPGLAALLEQHAEVARSDAERISVLRRLSDLYEREFLKPDKAAETLQIAFALDPHDKDTLAALERCFRATRAWAELAQALDVASLSDDETVSRANLLKLAEVQDVRMGDVAGARRTYERLYELAPHDEAVVGELARLAEKAGDLSAAAHWKGTLANLASVPAVRARLHVSAGQLLAAPDRDPAGARAHFEEAVQSDPSNEAAWNALLWDAKQAGDYARVAGYLATRAERCEAGRFKAQLFIELALVREKELGDELGALQAYEAARAADPMNEAAARALLEIYVATERWDDADAICERVAVSAERDGDLDLLAWSMRHGRRIALAHGEPERALAIAVSCFEIRPESKDVRTDLVESAHAMKDSRAALAAAKDALLLLAEVAEELSPAQRTELGDALVACGEPTRAEALYKSALKAQASNTRALAGLATVALAAGSWQAAGEYQVLHARTLEAEDAKYARLVEAGETFSAKANEPRLAAQAFEEARSLRPHGHQLLHALLAEYQKLEDWLKVTETLRAIANADSDPLRKSKTVFTMAQIAQDILNDAARAVALYEESLDLDATRLEAFERLVRLWTERHDWANLVKSYQRMLVRIAGDAEHDSPDAKLEHALLHQLGLVYRDRLRDFARAADTFRAALERAPDDPEDQAILRELLSLGGRVEDAAALALEQVRRDPFSPSSYASLFNLMLDAPALDRAWCVATVMNHLGIPEPGAQAFHRAHPAAGLESIGGTLDATAQAKILHPDLDPLLTTIFETVAPAVIDVKISQVSWRDRLAYPGPALPSSAAWVTARVAQASAALGVKAPRLYARPGSGAALAAGATRPPSLTVAMESLDALPDNVQPFAFGKRVFELTPPLLARAVCPTVTELVAVLGAVSRAVGAKGARGPADEALRSKLKKGELDLLADAVATATSRGAKVEDVQRWSELADLSTSRAGLVLVGDIELARGVLAREPLSPGDLPLREQLRALVHFALSDTFFELRRALGITV